MRKFLFSLALLVLAVIVTAGIAEGLIRFLNPQQTLSPRYMFNQEYGLIPFPNCTMVHAQPGRFRFTYRINARHHRGVLPPLSNRYALPNLVVLGDSYSFGMGVAEGEEFPALLGSRLAGRYEVANLAAPGWGLTQAIRRFYELGQLYQPAAVVLQFCRNDVGDNLLNPVTRIRDGRFEFVESDNGFNHVKKYLSRSILQRSQLYNFLRYRIADQLSRRKLRNTGEQLGSSATAGGATAGEQVYRDLLDLFARDLHRRGTRLIFMSANGQVDEFPGIREKLSALQHEGMLEVLDPAAWLGGVPDYRSPEGHVWGAQAHAIIAERLAEVFSGTPEFPAGYH